MAFSATDWRNRMSYYDGYYSAFTWGALGDAQGNRKYYMDTYTFYYGYTGQTNMQYKQCSTYYNTPCVEPFYVYSSWAVVYEIYYYYQTEFGYYFTNFSSGNYSTGNWYSYIGQNTYDTALGTAYVPPGFTYSFFYSGFPYSYYSEYTAYALNFGGISSISPSTFYNYKNGPYLSYYQYSLSNGYNTNYPYQVVYIGGACA
jgi:hypothetical protein